MTAVPDDPDAHYALGITLHAAGQDNEAVMHFRQALALRPDFADAACRLGECLAEQDWHDEAIACLRDALTIQPGSIRALTGLGKLLLDNGRADEAVELCEAAIARDPTRAEAHEALGTALARLNRLDAAEASHRRALALDPGFQPAYCSLAVVQYRQGDLAAAEASCRTAVRLQPDDARAHFDLAYVLLARGELGEGWREFEWRRRLPDLAAHRRAFAQPQWRGEPAAGKTLLIHGEEGFGDMVQFCRYAPLASWRGLRVIVQVQRPLTRLLASLPGVAQVLALGEPEPAFDLHCPMMSLPLAFATTLATVPAPLAYLHAEPAAAAEWRHRMDADCGPARRVGLVWSGRAGWRDDGRRSIPPALLAPLLAVPDIRFVSLQKGGAPPPEDAPLFDPMPEIGDFADTAAVIANLDLVISVDTAVAHVAGALGKPVWLLDRFDPCWRWLRGRTGSPWYPTLRIYRQTAPGDWPPVVARVAADLAGFGRG